MHDDPALVIGPVVLTGWLPTIEPANAGKTSTKLKALVADISTFNEQGVNPAEFENLAASTTLWKSQKLVGGVGRLHKETPVAG